MRLLTGFILFGLLLNFSVLSAQEKVDKVQQEKFTVKEGYLLDVESKFGDVEITNVEGNEVKIVAEIWVESRNVSKAEDLLDKLDVKLSQSGNTVSVKTVLPENMNNGKDTKFEINIKIQAPAYSNINMLGKYSNVYIQELNGHAMLDMAYSNFKIGSLNRGNLTPLNEIKFAYSDGHIDKLNWVKMDMAYSKIDLTEASSVVLVSKYSDIKLGKCGSFIVDSKYDKFNVEELDNYNGIFKYSGIKIGNLKRNLEVESAYSNLSVEKIAAGFELIKIDSRYGGAKIILDPESSFTIKAESSVGSVSVPDIKISTEKKNGTDEYFEGSYGQKPKSKIDVVTKTGNVKFSFD